MSAVRRGSAGKRASAVRRSTAAVAVVLAAFMPLAWAAPASGAAPPRTSLTAVENDLMCVACHEPLAVSQSPQAESERRLISHLIRLGDTKAQIEHVMVVQYGPSVLARPPAHGFNLTVYILPPAILIVGIGTLALLLPRWRRRSRANAAARAAIPEPSIATADARRLDEELRRYGG